MKKLLLLCFMSLFFSVAHAQSQSENQQVDYPVSDGQSLRFAIPSNWEVRANPQPYELRFSSANPETVTGIFVYKKEDLAEESTPNALLERQIEVFKSKIKNFKVVEDKQTVTRNFKALADSKVITSALYVGDFEASRYYYYFTLIEPAYNKDVFLLSVQFASPSDWKKMKPVLDAVTLSTQLVDK